MTDTPFSTDFRALLAKHGITAPRFAHSARAFDAAKPQVLYSGPVYDTDELVAATSALVEGKWAVAGEYVTRFEREFSAYLKQAESVMVNSGSSADLLMIAAAKKRYGWSDGDGVIVSPVGFPTSISAITLNGLTPVFVDIEWKTLNADNDAVEHELKRATWYSSSGGRSVTFPSPVAGRMTRRWLDSDNRALREEEVGPPIRAILISPVLGNPPDIDRLVALSEQYGVKLLMDGCDSLGTTWKGQHLAQYTTATSCSFFPSHHISTMQGGMVSSNDRELIDLVRSMSAWGKDCWCTGAGNLLPNGCCGKRFSCWLPTCPDVTVDHRYVYTTDRAYNLQPIDAMGALGLTQMKKLPLIHEKRRASYNRIASMLTSILGFPPVKVLPQASPSWFGTPVVCPDYPTKRALVTHLEAAGVQTRNYFAGNILAHPGYAHLGRAEDYSNAQQVLQRLFFLGAAPFYDETHFTHIETTLRSFKTS